MRKITVMAALSLSLGVFSGRAQTSCNDVNGYPHSKNIAGTGAYTLLAGMEENAAQTFNYSGPGKITGVRIHGYTPNWATGVELLVKVYHVDASGRPTSVIGSRLTTWSWHDNFNGSKDVSFNSGGYNLNTNFAVGIEVVNGHTGVTQFQVEYNGNGEGRGEDLASLAGTSTGFNWASAKNTFNKDGDFYIEPKMTNYITSDFNASTTCAITGSTIALTNTTAMTLDSMFNKIGMANYAGANYFYTWNFGDGTPVSHAINPTHVYSAAGVYTISLTSQLENWGAGCSNTFTKQISVGLSAGAPLATGASCYGSTNGSFTVTPTGGAAPYKFSKDGDTYVSGATFAGLASGSYTVYVKDALGCIKTSSVYISQPLPIVFSQATTTSANCNNTNGAVQASASGGSGSIQYSLNGSTWQSSGTFLNLGAAAYTVWAKDGNGCTSSIGAAVSNLGSPSLTISSMTNVNCFGASNATISATATGGTGVLQYSIDGIGFQTNGNFSGLAADTFFVIVKDASGCQDIKTVITIAPPQLAFTASSTSTLCNGSADGYITMNSVVGGTGTMNYSIGGGIYQSANTFSGVSAGNYTVSVKDASGCVAQNLVLVTQPTLISITATTTNLSCNNSGNGSISAQAAGGTARYNYSIDGENFYPTGDFEELSAGTYTISVRDHNGCIQTITSTVTQPTTIASTVTIGNSTCGNANGNILVAAAGGSGSGYEYSIDGTTWNSTGSFTSLIDSTYNILVQDGSACNNEFLGVVSNSDGPVINTVSSTNITCFKGHNGTINITNVTGGSGTLTYQVGGYFWQTATSFTGLAAGTYIVKVKDGLGCSGSYQVTLTQPAAIIVNPSVTNLACYGISNGSVTVSAGGGSGTPAYSLNGLVYQSSNIFNSLSAGVYQVNVRDAGGCIGVSSFVITSPEVVTISNPGILDVTCNGETNGAINVTANGGTGSLQYSLDGITYQSSNNFLALNGGSYTIYVKDANACIKTQIVSINEPTVLDATASVSPVSCAGGHNGYVSLNVTGGTPGYAYNWSNEAGTTATISNLSPGTYSVTITDENGCIKTHSSTITQPANPLIINAVVNDASGIANADGDITITVTGGTTPYTYNWSNGYAFPDNGSLIAGSYTATITDANGCVTSGVYTVGTTVGLQNVVVSDLVRIYPNPANSVLTVESGNVNLDQVEILNIIGEVLYKVTPNDNRIEIGLEGLNEGLYFLRYKVNSTYVTKRFEIVK